MMVRMRPIAALCALTLIVSGCAQQPKMVWMRIDGQSIRQNPALLQQAEIDRTICAGETQKANMSGAQFCRGLVDCAIADGVRSGQAMDVAKGCMASKGYVLVPETDLEQKEAIFAQNAAKMKRRAGP